MASPYVYVVTREPCGLCLFCGAPGMVGINDGYYCDDHIYEAITALDMWAASVGQDQNDALLAYREALLRLHEAETS